MIGPQLGAELMHQPDRLGILLIRCTAASSASPTLPV